MPHHWTPEERAFLERVAEMAAEASGWVMAYAKAALRNGSLSDKEVSENSYIAPKAVLAAALSDMAEDWRPGPLGTLRRRARKIELNVQRMTYRPDSSARQRFEGFRAVMLRALLNDGIREDTATA